MSEAPDPLQILDAEADVAHFSLQVHLHTLLAKQFQAQGDVARNPHDRETFTVEAEIQRKRAVAAQKNLASAEIALAGLVHQPTT